MNDSHFEPCYLDYNNSCVVFSAAHGLDHACNHSQVRVMMKCVHDTLLYMAGAHLRILLGMLLHQLHDRPIWILQKRTNTKTASTLLLGHAIWGMPS